MSAIFDFSSLLTVILFLICTCAYLRDMRPTIFDGGQVSSLHLCLDKDDVVHEIIFHIINLRCNFTHLFFIMLLLDTKTWRTFETIGSHGVPLEDE